MNLFFIRPEMLFRLAIILKSRGLRGILKGEYTTKFKKYLRGGFWTQQKRTISVS